MMPLAPTRMSNRVRVQVAAAAIAILVFVVAVGGAWHGGGAGKGSAKLGALAISHARLPQPASPDTAVLYLDVKNSGSAPDMLIGVSASFASGGMVMTDRTEGSQQQMQQVDGLTIPAHGSASLSPGAFHGMLVGLTSSPKQGQTVTVTLHFQNAGSVTLAVPVTSYAQE
jgi:copper(I)-binding protein